ncbi:MAG TPA: C2H2-type zinc finger protein [Bacillota bacterium]
MGEGVRPFELVDHYEEVVANVRQFNEDLKNGLYMIHKLSQFKEWFYFPELDAFGPSKFIGYKEMNAGFYNNGHRTQEQKRIGSMPLNGGKSTTRLERWFREIPQDEPLFKQLQVKIDSFFTTFGKKPNKALQLFYPKDKIIADEFNKLSTKYQKPHETIYKPESEDEKPIPTDREQRSPIKRGGRSRNQSTAAKEKLKNIQDNNVSKLTPLRMDIICWDDYQWNIGLEFYGRLKNIEVFQDGRQLNPCNYYNTRFIVESRENIKIVSNEQESILSLPLGTEEYYIFKLKKDWKSPGRLVSTLNRGSYIIMTPQGWKRDEELNPAPCGEEYVACWGLKAHFFLIDRNSRVRFVTGEGKEIIIRSNTCLELEGEQIIDDGEMGPLFIRHPPSLKVSSVDYWDSVSVLIIGREGKGTNRWRMEYQPERLCKQDLPKELEERGGGWYFIRVYDQEARLKESLDFRFSKGLQELIIPPFQTPTIDGYAPIELKFVCAAGCTIQPAKDTILTLKEEPTGYSTQIPSQSMYDQTGWRVDDSGAKTALQVTIDRIWWVVNKKDEFFDGQEANWQAQQLVFSPEDFYATSKKVLWIKITNPPETRNVELGFGETPSRGYSIPGDNLLMVPLSDFTDTMNWAEFAGSVDVKLWIPPKCEIGIKLARVCYEFTCEWCGATFSESENLIEHVREKHLNDIYPLLSYEEMQRFMLDLPKKIYQCSYCNYYVKTNDLDNPTSKITEHVEKCKEIYSGKLNSFRVIRDLNEIRANVIRSLPGMYECRLCTGQKDKIIRERRLGGKIARVDHLLNHRNEIIQTCRKRG